MDQSEVNNLISNGRNQVTGLNNKNDPDPFPDYGGSYLNESIDSLVGFQKSVDK